MKSKLSKQTLLFVKASKILQKYYAHILNGRDLTRQEVIAEAINLLRKDAKGNLDDSQEWLFFQLDRDDWRMVAQYV